MDVHKRCLMSLLPWSHGNFPFCRRGVLIFAAILILGAGCSKEARKSHYLAKAERDFQAEQYDRAEVEFLSALKLAPLDPAAISRLGVIYQIQGKFLPAFTYLRKALELSPGDLEARLKSGLLYSRLHKSKEARDEAMRVLEKQPWNEDALLLLCDSATDSKDMSQILDLIDRSRQQDIDRAPYHLVLGALHLRDHNPDKAESELKRAVAMDPNSAAAYLVLGNLYLLENDLPRAEAALKASAGLSPWHSARRLSYADFKLKTGAPAKAKDIAEEITRKAPDYLPAWLFLAQTAAAEHRFEDCDSCLQRILGRDPSNYEALLFESNLLIARGDGTNAVAHLEHVRTIYKNDPQVCAQLAVAHLLNLDVAKARASLSQALAANPNFADATLLLAELDIRQGKAASAIAAMQKLVEQQPQVARAHLLLADAYLGQKDFDSALSVYRRMMELFPQSPQVPLLLGIQLAQRNQLMEARKAFEKSLELAPDSISAFEQLVNLDLAEKQYASATERVKLRLTKTPRSANPWLLFAKIHLAKQEINEAETALLKAIELEPELRNPYLFLADIYRNSNKSDLALQKLNSLLSRSTNDVAALLQIALIQTTRTNFPAARDAYERLLGINPKSNIALNNLACLYGEQLGQLDKAYELACKGRRLYPTDPFTADTLGWILHKQGDYLHALGSLQESARYLSAEPEVQFHLGMAYYMMGEEQQARLAFERSLQSTNDFTGKQEASRCLAVLAVGSKPGDPRALADLESHIRANPRDTMLLTRLAAICERDGHLDEAARICEKALKLNSQNPHIMIQLAQIYGRNPGDLLRALKLAKVAHNITPDNPHISYALGRLVYLGGDQKWALSLIADAASRLPPGADIQYDLALCYYAVGEVQKARAMLEKAIESGTSFTRVGEARLFLELVVASHGTGDGLTNAIAKAELALNIDPRNLPALLILALAREQQGNYPKAKEIYENMLAIAPSFSPAAKHLAEIYSQHLADDQRAYELASKVRETFPDDPDVARTLGILTYRLGKDNTDFARSAQLLRESALKRTEDPELFYYLGLAEYQTKQLQESKEALQRALTLNLQSKFADDARRVLAKLN
jgi:putative PEP-CTERM system TPR-repeat lipoprotein